MSADLAIDKLEAAPSFGDLLAEAGSEFGEEVAVFARGSFGIAVQLGDFAGGQRVPLGIERGDIALGVLYLARDAEKLSSGAFAGDGGVDFAVIVKQTLQGFGVATAVRLIGASHQQGEVLLLGVVAREVGVDALGDIAEECLEAGRWVELLGFVGIAKCGIVSFLRTVAGLFGSAPGGVGVVEIYFALGDARFKVVEFGVEDADLAQVSTFEGLELGSDLGKLGFALGEHRTDAGKLLAFVEEDGVVRGLLKDDFGWHAASHEGSSSLAERSSAFRRGVSREAGGEDFQGFPPEPEQRCRR
jgi:hypothetical protein